MGSVVLRVELVYSREIPCRARQICEASSYINRKASNFNTNAQYQGVFRSAKIHYDIRRLISVMQVQRLQRVSI